MYVYDECKSEYLNNLRVNVILKMNFYLFLKFLIFDKYSNYLFELVLVMDC